VIGALAVVGGIAMVMTILHWIVSAFREGAVAQAEIERLEREALLRAKQAQEMQKDLTVEDVARDLDRGEF
jgi:heme exporter protein D